MANVNPDLIFGMFFFILSDADVDFSKTTLMKILYY